MAEAKRGSLWRGWSVEKRIDIPTLLAVVSAFVAIVVAGWRLVDSIEDGAAALAARVTSIEEKVAGEIVERRGEDERIRAELQTVRDKLSDMTADIAVTLEKAQNIEESVRRIEGVLEAIRQASRPISPN